MVVLSGKIGIDFTKRTLQSMEEWYAGIFFLKRVLRFKSLLFSLYFTMDLLHSLHLFSDSHVAVVQGLWIRQVQGTQKTANHCQLWVE